MCHPSACATRKVTSHILCSNKPFLPTEPFVPDSQIINGNQLDQNNNDCLPREEESFSSTEEPNETRFIKRTEVSPIRISNKQPAMEPSNCQISASSSGIRISLPAFTVKVSTGQSASQGPAKFDS